MAGLAGGSRTVTLGSLDPFEVFGLTPDASMVEIRGRYRQLALAYHPDRRGGNDPRRAKQFTVVCEAYEAILQAREAAEKNQSFGICPGCGQTRSLSARLDGTPTCAACLVRPRWTRMLPAPPMVIVKCTFSIACLTASAACLVMGYRTGSWAYLAWSGGVAAAGLLVVALLGLLFPVMRSDDLRRSRAVQSKTATHRRGR